MDSDINDEKKQQFLALIDNYIEEYGFHVIYIAIAPIKITAQF